MTDPVTPAVEPVVAPEAAPVAPATIVTAEPVPGVEPAKAGDESGTPPDPKKAEADAKPGAPETYEDFTLPDGLAKDEAALDAFKTLAKEHGLTQEAAQKFVDLQAKLVSEMSDASSKAFQEQNETWVSAAKNDKEFGLIKFNENLAVAKSALNTYGNDALKEVLNVTGAGNHPEVIRFLWKIGKEMADGKIHTGGTSGAPEPKSLADRIYTKTS